MVAYPYTKLMTAIMDVDMAAAVVLASAAKADALGVPEERRVYLRGWGYAEDPAHVAGHPELWRSPAMAAAAAAALAGAGIGVDDVAHLDLYSCFASSVCFALDALGIGARRPAGAGGDPDGRPAVPRRPGLQLHDPLAGGHGRDPAPRPRFVRRGERGRHAHAEARLRGLVDGARARRADDPRAVRRPAGEPVGIVASPEGDATVATYSVLHGRDGEPERALLVCDLPAGGRCYALLDGGAPALREAEAVELIGRPVTLTPQDQLNLARLA